MRDCLQRCGRRWRRNEAWSGKRHVDSESFRCFCPSIVFQGSHPIGPAGEKGRPARYIGFVQLRQDSKTGLSGGEKQDVVDLGCNPIGKD